ncbi:9975_t:CDS:2 [Ambispora leptoticha]|uniref:9975_t:CDS:1 n=1 Tax=Ambispora leptoticha TaxID=144679 RepID=A0A9N8ZQP1_9GLOM|nr:9975_t:CDS:2 [Ambispora leptoticha]
MECDENSSESESTSQSTVPGKRKAATNKGGCPRTSIWEDFNKLSSDGEGHYGAKCRYCKKSWKQGKPTTFSAKQLFDTSKSFRTKTVGPSLDLESLLSIGHL